MLYREIIAVCSQIHTKHINTPCGQNVELLNVKLAVHIVITGLSNVKKVCFGVKCNGSKGTVRYDKHVTMQFNATLRVTTRVTGFLNPYQKFKVT